MRHDAFPSQSRAPHGKQIHHAGSSARGCVHPIFAARFRVAPLHSSRADSLTYCNLCRFCASNIPHACCRPGDSPTITGCVLLHGVCATRCSRNLSAKHRPRIDPKYSGFVKARPLSTAHLSMISVNNQRQHELCEEGKQKYGARGVSPRTRLCNQRAERH